MQNKKAFTLIELLIVIAIIGILASIVLVSLSNARTKAKIASTERQLQNIISLIEVARMTSGDVLGDITGSTCSACAAAYCRDQSVALHDDTGACYTQWNTAISNIATEAGSFGQGATRDPWGSPFLLDENEGSWGDGCVKDNIRSNGPDGLYGSGDDIAMHIPLSRTECL